MEWLFLAVSVLLIFGYRRRLFHRASPQRVWVPEQPPLRRTVLLRAFYHAPYTPEVPGFGALDGRPAHGPGRHHRLDGTRAYGVRIRLLRRDERKHLLLLEPEPRAFFR